jgi:hypothetical protein
MGTNICSTYYTYSSMFENCFESIIIYIYRISLKCGNNTGSLSNLIYRLAVGVVWPVICQCDVKP